MSDKRGGCEPAGPEHTAERPSWDCRVCGAPWPCESAREWLLKDIGPGTALRAYGWAYYEAYITDGNTTERFSVAMDRFLRWTYDGLPPGAPAYDPLTGHLRPE